VDDLVLAFAGDLVLERFTGRWRSSGTGRVWILGRRFVVFNGYIDIDFVFGACTVGVAFPPIST
jgi:hypothetical protein